MFNPSTTPFQPGQIDQTMVMLASLKDQGKLQQYVMQHQCNPNLVALASQVNSMSQQPPPMPQGTVKDQAIQAMAPQQVAPQAMGQSGMSQQDPEAQIRQAIDESIANKDFDTAKKLITKLKEIDKIKPPEPMGATPEEAPNNPTGAPIMLPEDQGIGTLPAQNLQGMGHASGGIIGYDKGGSTYKPLTDKDIYAVTNPTDNQGNSTFVTPEQLQMQQEAMAGDKNRQVESDYAPFAQRLAERQEKLNTNSGSNLGTALLTAGLGMMAGTSPYAMVNIGQGGLHGLTTYTAAQKADQQAQDALDNANMAFMQAKRAEKAGNYRDAALLMDTAQKQNDAKVSHGLAALQLKNTSQYQNEEAIAKRMQIANEAAKIEADKDWKKTYGDYLIGKGGPQSAEQKEIDNLFKSEVAELVKKRADLIAGGSPSDAAAINALTDQINAQTDNIYGSRPHIQHPGYLPKFNEEIAKGKTHFFSPDEPGKLEMMPTPRPPQMVQRQGVPGVQGLPSAQQAGAPLIDFSSLPK